MKTDRTTKILLAFIALGLWLNALAPLWHPRPVAAQDPDHDIHQISESLQSISDGLCLNKTLCK